MIPTLIQRPPQFCFSKNQLLWRFYIDDPLAAGCLLDFYVKCDTMDADPAKSRIYQEQVKPSSNGYMDIFVQDIIDSMIDYELPAISGAVIQPAANIRTLKMKFRELTNAIPNPSWETSEETNTRYVIKGGIEQLKHDYNNYFLNYYASNKPFSTWQPGNSFVGIYDTFYTGILLANTAITGWILRVVADWTDGTNDTIDITPTDMTKMLYMIKAGAQELGINALATSSGKMLWRYSLQARNNADTNIIYSEAYMFYADYRNFYNTKVFNYFNSLGGIDHIRVLGDQEDDFTRSFAEIEIFIGSTTPGDPPLTQYAQAGHARLNTYKSDTGLLHKSSQMMALQEIFTSACIWEVLNSKNRLVWILNKNAALKKKTDKKWGFPIEYRYGYTEQVYTPADVDLGVGASDEVYPGEDCPLVTGVVITDMGSGNIRFNWTVSASSLYYTLEYKLITDSSWTGYGSPIVLGSMPVTISVSAGSYDYRIKTTCDDIDHPTSPWFYGTFLSS